MVQLLTEPGLDRVEELTIEDGWLLAGKNLTFEDDLADIEPVAQKIGERAAGKRDSSHDAAHPVLASPLPILRAYDVEPASVGFSAD
jgi:hypothetical protein